VILIFGVRAYVKALAFLTLACRNGHVAGHRVLKVTRKFTLFFVPLFPVQTRFYTECAQCGLWVPWNKEEAEAAARSSPATAAGPAGPATAAGPAGPGGPASAAPGSAPGGPAGSGSSGAGWVRPADPVAPPLRPVSLLHLAPPTAAPGWYPDPAGEGEFRYWDGAVWTEAVHGGPTG
jgi:hypothetical protein